MSHKYIDDIKVPIVSSIIKHTEIRQKECTGIRQ